jgi:glycosyltransferase involved in cell wall biosynthesis
MNILNARSPPGDPKAALQPLLSVVVPFHNEAAGIERLYQGLSSALQQIQDIRFEVVCVDDGSNDDTLPRLIALTGRDARFRVIELSRNFGKEAALSAGIDAATGEAVIPFDADLQDPPELIAALIAEWRKGADIVLARRIERSSDSFLKRTTAGLFYRVHNRLSDIQIPDNVGDFRLMNRAAVDAFKQLPERNRFTKGLFAWVGFKTVTVDYARSPRITGKTKFSGWKLWNFALEGFTSFSTAPLKLWMYVGGVGALGSLIYASIIILRTLIRGVDVPGYASILVVVLFVGSIQLIGIGVLGEYIGRIYLETKQRPRYVVRRRYDADTAVTEGTSTAGAPEQPGSPLEPALPPAQSSPHAADLKARAHGLAALPSARRPGPLLTLGAIAVIVTATVAYNGWLLDPRTFFYNDDWQWLWRSEFFPWSGGFSILPEAAYNDRPIGAVVFKLMYEAFGLDHQRFQLALLFLHALNCVLVYAVAVRMVGRAGALLAALLAATWFSSLIAVGWPAAIFDLLGATLCLATVWFRQLAIKSGGRLRYDIAGAVCFLLAIRTKEFAIGTVGVLFLMGLLAERQSVRATIRQLAPYLIVFAVLAARYVQLLATAAPAEDDPYRLVFTVSTVIASLRFYLSTLFYADILRPWGLGILIVVLAGALLIANAQQRRVVAFGLAGFAIMLGPTLFLVTTAATAYHALYLYTPHFFMALVVGALLGHSHASRALTLAVALAILISPIRTDSRKNIVNFYFDLGAANQAMLNSAVEVLTPLPPGATVFISGVKPYFNPFWTQPGNALKVAFKDFNLTVEVEKPEDELVAKFCDTAGTRRFLRFEGTRAVDVTAVVAGNCDAPNHRH